MARAVRWDLFVNPRGYIRGYDQAEQRSRRFERHMQRSERNMLRFSSSVGSLGPVAVRAFGGAAVAAGGLAAAGAVLGLKTAANLETAEVGFTRLLGSAKRARSFLGDLKTFAARTPFELPGLVDAARGLVGAGTAAKNVIPILTALGDASGALGLDQERFGRVMVATTQIMNKGKVQAEELMQITEAGIPVWQLLAKATGKPVPELQKLMQQGKLLAKDVLPALFRQMRKDYGGGMAQQSKTLVGIWSTFKDTLSLTLADGLKPLIPIMKTALPAAGEAFQRTIEGITRFFRSDLAPELGRVRLAWDQNRDSILGFATSLSGSQSSMVTSKDAASGLADTLERLVNFGGDLADFGDRVAGHLNDTAESSQRSAHALHEWGAELVGILTGKGIDGFEPFARDVDDVAGATQRAATAAERHAAAMRGQTDALASLRGALDAEKASEIELRQAKLNVQTAQKRVNDLKADGKTKSFEYRQAQLDLERAQIALRHKTDDYKTAQQKANLATSDARQAASHTARTYGGFRDAAAKAGSAAWLMGDKIKDGLLRIPKGRVIKVTATFGFRTPPNVSMHDIVGAHGGYVTPTAITPRRLHRGGLLQGPGTETSDSIPARLSRGEYVVNARAVRRVGRQALDDINAQSFARGGLALDASFPATGRLTRSFTGFLGVIDRSMERLAGKWDRFAERFMGKPGIQQFIRSTDPLPYVWGGAGPGGYDCSGLVGAVYGKHTGRGGGAGQRYFTTASIGTGVAGLKPGLGGVLNIGVTPSQGHMSGSYAGLGFEARSTRSGIIVGPGARSPASFARQFHMARGGLVDERLVALAALAGLDIGGDQGRLRINGKVLDQGGYLMPGQAGINLTSKPERFLGPGERFPTADEIARAVARELAKVLPTTVSVADVHAGLLRRKRQQGGVALGLS
jgi:tape measure domain-containing protein